MFLHLSVCSQGGLHQGRSADGGGEVLPNPQSSELENRAVRILLECFLFSKEDAYPEMSFTNTLI